MVNLFDFLINDILTLIWLESSVFHFVVDVFIKSSEYIC